MSVRSVLSKIRRVNVRQRSASLAEFQQALGSVTNEELQLTLAYLRRLGWYLPPEGKANERCVLFELLWNWLEGASLRSDPTLNAREKRVRLRATSARIRKRQSRFRGECRTSFCAVWNWLNSFSFLKPEELARCPGTLLLGPLEFLGKWPSAATSKPHFETRRLVEALRFDFSELGEAVNDVFRQLALPRVNWHVGLPRADLFSEFTYYVDGINSVISEAIDTVRNALVHAGEVPDGWEEPYPPSPVRCPRDLLHWIQGELNAFDKARSRGLVSIRARSKPALGEPYHPDDAWNRIRRDNWKERLLPVYFNARQSLMTFRWELDELAPRSPKNFGDAYDRLVALRRRLEDEGLGSPNAPETRDTGESTRTPESDEQGPLSSGDVVANEAQDEPKPFSGGTLVFFVDRVEICGVNVCSGPRSGSRRIVLELLSQRRNGKSFIGLSGEELEVQAKKRGAKGTAVGWIRDLRSDIIAALRTQANILCGKRDVIVSGGSGYRFSDCLTVHSANASTITDITDTAKATHVRDDDVCNVCDTPDDEATRRRKWIIQQLRDGVKLNTPMVAAHFHRTKRTAQRDLDALREAGRIKFIGDPRTGHYQLVAGK